MFQSLQSFFGFGSGGGFGQFPGGHPFGMGFGQFRERYRCFSMVFSTKTSEEITHGGKIIMPPSALEKLSRLNISYPMLFKLSSGSNDNCTHCGVLEFVAEEGRVYVPHWVSGKKIHCAPLPSPFLSLSLSPLPLSRCTCMHKLLLSILISDDQPALHPRW